MNDTALTIYRTACYFVIYAFLGWCLEVVYQAVEHGKFINRGFLNGPYCPIYGFGVILVCYSLEPIKENIVVLYVGSVLLTTFLELITGFLLEKVFAQKWWDYTRERFNLKGYICLKFSLLWGVACLVTVRLIHPLTVKFVNDIPHTLGIILLSLILSGFLSDTIITVFAIIHIKRRLVILEGISSEMRKISDKTGEKLFNGVEHVMDKKSELDERNAEYRKKLSLLKERYAAVHEKRSMTLKRLSKAFPHLNIIDIKDFRRQLEELRENIQNKKD
ncbi:putative ABC transporter permease [Ruminococcus flavefaciens]|uniref:putative ABC transporter permease n=1 Tax=Ruminococcus flavefaciens TaxID=1265 RepID=UPI0026EC5458|nr:putative ABC transporter permease [Ruminococcus flavefaciens]